MAISFDKGAKQIAALTALATAGIGNTFAQERSETSRQKDEATATAPLDPISKSSNSTEVEQHSPLTEAELSTLLEKVDRVLSEDSADSNELKTSYFPRKKSSEQDLLLRTLGDFNRDDFDTIVTRRYSLESPGEPTFSYRLTCIRTNPDPEDTLKVSTAHIDYKLPIFEAVRFESSLAEKGFSVVSIKEREADSSLSSSVKSSASAPQELTEGQTKAVLYMALGALVALGSAVWWAANTGLRMFRWLVTKNPDTPMATPLKNQGHGEIAPWETVQYSVIPGIESPCITSQSSNPSRLNYTIKGGSQPIITLQLKPGEAIVTETGSLLLKDSDISMSRVGGSTEGYTPDRFGIIKRWLMGESFWFLKYKNETEQAASLVLSPSKVGTMLGVNLAEFSNGLVADGGSFFAAGRGVKLATNRLLSIGGLMSGLGPFQQRLTGNGEAFLFSSGEIHEMQIEKGQKILLDPDAVFAWEPSVKVQSKWLGLWSGIVSGEGFFLCSASGEGRLFYSSRGMRDDPAKDRTGGPTGVVSKYVDKLM